MKLFEMFKKNKIENKSETENADNKKVLEGLDDYIIKHFVWPGEPKKKEVPLWEKLGLECPYDEFVGGPMADIELYNSCIHPSMHSDIELIGDDEESEPAEPGEEKRQEKKHAMGMAASAEAVCAAPVEASGSALSKEKKGRKLEDVVLHVSDTWQESLLHIIDERGLRDSVVYKKAGIDRKLFSKIRSNKDYKPKKSTAVLFALALELNLDDMKDMLARAGFALSPSSVSDLIIEYFVMNDVHDIYTINMALHDHNQAVLGE